MPNVTLSIDLYTLLGIVSAALSTWAFCPYILNTLRGRTKPQRASWLIWSVLSSIAFVLQIYEGAIESAWFVGSQAFGTVTVFLLSLRYGSGNLLGRQDAAVLIVALMGLIAWKLTDTPAYALAIIIGISALGGSVTVTKSYRFPSSETLTTWVLFAVASFLAVIPVQTAGWMLLAYPLYLFVLYTAIVLAILFGQRMRRLGTPA
ncbi:MAG: hypothetical protein AAFO72_02750 [Pseudomonadota bacterium]